MRTAKPLGLKRQVPAGVRNDVFLSSVLYPPNERSLCYAVALQVPNAIEHATSMLDARRDAFTAALVLLLLLARTESTTSTRPTAHAEANRSLVTPSTCAARSINYITQTLPQQCFTSSWAIKPQLQHATANENAIPSTAHTTHLSILDTTGTTVGISRATQLEEHSSAPSLAKLDTSVVDSESQVLSSPSELLKPSQTASESIQESETDSPLDNANFLSFEEWKHQNLEKVGQSAESLGARSDTASEQRKRPGNINNALDSLGEDTEIDIDFGGFVNHGPMREAPPLRGTRVQETDNQGDSQNDEEQVAKDASGLRKRPKDAGRTCKERTNYASYDCAATTLKTNTECRSASAVLVENKDSYMLNMCSAPNKFFIVELCDNILIDTIVLANFEFFSSIFRTFRISVSDKYPVKLEKWRELGVYEARNTREVQAFLVENPLIWARYLRVEFLTHYGNEYYCPVSLLRVHGTTMMEEFNSEMKNSGGDDDSEGEGSDTAEAEAPTGTTSVIITEKVKSSATVTDAIEISSGTEITATTATLRLTTLLSSQHSNDSTKSPVKSADLTLRNPSADALEEFFKPWKQHQKICLRADEPSPAIDLTSSGQVITTHTAVTTPPPKSGAISQEATSTSVKPSINQTLSPDGSGTNRTTSFSSSSLAAMSTSSHAAHNVTTSLLSIANSTTASNAKAQSSLTQPPASNPTTQESFFKSMHKRLQLLEANSTLSLQYIEEQSRILRDAFSKVEKRQMTKTTNFLETLNMTVLTELHHFRKQYDQIWQSTVLELSSQREQSQHEVFALSARLSILADEIVFQRRMAILQFMLILLCLAIVIFSRHGSTVATYSELPHLVQAAINRSSANLSRYATHFESPSDSPSASRSPSRYGLFRTFTHRRSPSEESCAPTSEKSRNIEYSPPTPDSQRSVAGDVESSPNSSLDREGLKDDPPLANEEARPKSTPPTPERKGRERIVLGEGESL